MRISALGALVCGASLLAACGEGAAPAASPAASSAPVKPAASSAAAASSAPAKPAASASAKPAASAAGSAAASAKPAAAGNGPIRIGLDESLTGSFATIGKDHQDGFMLYLESIGNTIAGRKVEVVVADDGGRPDQGLTKAKQLVESDKVHLITGVHISPICNALVGYAKEA